MDRRFELALGHFEKALSRLEESLAYDESDMARDSVIKRFEFTFEMAWKACYRWLRARNVDVDEEAFAVLPRAFQNRLVTDEAAWSDIRKARNKTSHTYHENVAIEVAAYIRSVAAPAFHGLVTTLRVRADE